MFQCHVCGGKQSRQDTVTHIFFIKDKPIIVENIPATICIRCGEPVFHIDTVEKIREMIHGKAKPVKSVRQVNEKTVSLSLKSRQKGSQS